MIRWLCLLRYKRDTTSSRMLTSWYQRSKEVLKGWQPTIHICSICGLTEIDVGKLFFENYPLSTKRSRPADSPSTISRLRCELEPRTSSKNRDSEHRVEWRHCQMWHIPCFWRNDNNWENRRSATLGSSVYPDLRLELVKCDKASEDFSGLFKVL